MKMEEKSLQKPQTAQEENKNKSQTSPTDAAADVSKNVSQEPKSDEYTANNITSLEGLEAVRMRPAMYIGSTSSRGLHHLVYEIVDNSIDEALAGHCNEIKVRIIEGGIIEVSDNGRGIPVDIHPKYGISALQVVMTKLHAGGKFDKKTYKVSGGLHGVGASCVNALSEFMTVQVMRDGKIYNIKFERGKALKDTEVIGTTDKRGTIVMFKPDATIFETTIYEYDILANRLRELAFLNKGIKITLVDERDAKRQEFYYTGGIVSFVEHINKNKVPLHPILFFEKQKDDTQLEVALQYNDSYNENIYSYVNNINTPEGGSHLTGFKSALTRCLNTYCEKHVKDKETLSSEDVREGLSAVISIKIPNPQFEGQTKSKLGNNDVKGIVDSMVFEKLNEYLEEHPSEAKIIMEKALTASRAREAAKKARDLTRRKGLLGSLALPGKLADCSSKDASKSEIFIVEGDSAGGCFLGNTKVALADGRELSFKELVKEDKLGIRNYCFTVNEGHIEIGLIKNPRRTKRNAEVIKLILDNGEEIICTPDHQFMMRNGSYKKAAELDEKISLMPLYRKISKKEGRVTIERYEMVFDPTFNKWIFSHVLADQYNLKQQVYLKDKGCCRHHVDFNRLNNSPENILRMSKEKHLQLHASNVKKTLLTPVSKEKARRIHKTLEYRQKIRNIMSTPQKREMLSARAKKQWENQEYKDYMIKCSKEFYNVNPVFRLNHLNVLNTAQKNYWADEENRLKQSKKVREYFISHADKKAILSESAKVQWKDKELLEWRKIKTSDQWNSDFRRKRKAAYDKTYLSNTLKFIKELGEMGIPLNHYDSERTKANNKNLLKLNTLLNRFFNGSLEKMIDAALNYNHKIVKIEKLSEKFDVYDLEVENTHNFALASGIFVHNSAKQGRDRTYQAILPLKGKILNVEKARLTKVLSNQEITILISALGCGIGDEFSIEKMRYHKVIIMTDADVDGAHIRTLLLTFFYRYMKPLIEQGYIYVAKSPLYRIKKGKIERYLYDEKEKEAAIKELGAEDSYIQRYKGLGEMNPAQLFETTMNMMDRKLVKIKIEDAIAADEMFTVLMGDQVEPRRKFIEDHAMEVTDLDV